MEYLRESLTPGEKIVHVARFHWMYNLQATFNIIFGVCLSIGVLVFAMNFEPIMFGQQTTQGLGLIERIQNLHSGVKIIAFFMILLGILRFVQMMIVKVTTTIAVTTKRLVYKRGLVARHVGEINIEGIEGVNILQGILGRIFGYGRVMVRGIGVGEIVLPPIAKPIKFRKAIEKAQRSRERKQERRQIEE